MGKARNRAERTGDMDVVIGSTKLVPDGSGDLEVKDASNNRKKIIASEIKLGSGNDIIIIKRNSSTGEAQFQSSSDGGSSTTEQTVGGAGTVTNASDLPITGNQAGDMKLVTSTNNLMIHNGSGWYKIATITNASPTISSAGDSSYNFQTDGTPVTIEIVASDPEGVALQYKYQVTTGAIGSIATVTNSATSGGTYSALAANTYSNNRFFKVTPSTSEAHAGTFAITFSVTDGVNTANSSASSFTLAFDIGASMSFSESKTGNAENEYLIYPNQYNLGTADWTIEFWVWFYDFGATSQSSNQNRGILLIGKNDGGIAIEGYDYNGSVNGRGAIRLLGNNGGHGVVLTSDSRILPRTWYHIAVTNDDSSNTQKLYINGVQDSATGSVSTAFTFSTAETLVGGTWWSNNLQLPFRGYLSNLRVVAGNVYTPSAQTSGSTVFDGTGDYLLTAEDNELVLGTGDFTIEHWIWSADTTNGGGSAQIIDMRKNGSAPGSDMYTYVNSSRQYVFGYGSDRITHRGLSNNTWYHIAIVRHNGVTTLYMNGEKRNDRGGSNTETWADTTNYTSNQMTVGIHGRDRSSFPFTGKISNLRVTVGTALYTNPLPPDNDVRFDRPLRPFTKVTNTQLLTCQNSTGSITDASDNNVTITAGGNAAADANHPFEAAGNDFTTGLAFDVPTSDLGNIANTKLLTLQEKTPTTVTNGAYHFTSNTSKVLASHTDFNLTSSTAFTVEMWYYLVSAPDSRALWDFGSGNAFQLYTASGNMKIYGLGGGYIIDFGSGVGRTLNQWYHVAITGDGSNNVKAYLDGVQVGSTYNASWSITGGKVLLNGNLALSQPCNKGIEAYFSDFRIVNGTQVYTGAFTRPSGPLTTTGGTYPSNTNVNTSITASHTKILTAQNSSGSLVDNSASGHTLTTHGTVTPRAGFVNLENAKDNSTSGVTPTHYNNVSFSYATPFEHTKGSVKFDGNGDAVTFRASADFSFGTGDFTIEGFVYSTTYSTYPYIYDGRTNPSASANAPVLYIHNDDTLRYYVAGSSRISTSYTSYQNKWTHVAVVRSSGTTALYLDGVQKGTWSDSTNYSDQGPVVLGRHGNSSNATYCLNGYMSNFRVLKGTAHYTSNFTVTSSPLTAITNTKLLTCNDTNIINDGSASNHSTAVNGNALPTKFSPF